MLGYHGAYLVVDLTHRSVGWEPLSENVLRRFIGGTGLGTYLLYEHCPPQIDPLDPANPLIFVTSPLVGSRLTTSSKFAVVTKSPLTGFIGDSLSSSFLATELKGTGCDALVITGRSEHPTLLSVHDGRVDFLDASDLTGLSTSETEAAVKERLGTRTRVACIGPAGEKLVRFASISNDGGRQAGRTGPGAVMGSKNLKAIAVRGARKVPVADSEWLDVTRRDLARRSLGPATEKYRTLGTVANVSVFNRLGTLPTLNFRQSTFDGAEPVSGEALHQSHHVKNAHCASCTIGCEQILATNDDGPRAVGRMEYESAFALGPLVGVADPNTVIRASRFCDDAGIDTISAGGTIAWAMECFDRGILTEDDTAGLDLRFGNADALMTALRMIADREGLGGLLAEGSRRAAAVVGNGSDAWAMQVKGLEMPGYEPRSLKTMALGLAVSTRGACHNRSSAYEADFSSSGRPSQSRRAARPDNRRGRGLLRRARLADLVQVPAQGLPRPVRRVGGNIRAHHRMAHDRRRSEAVRRAHQQPEEAVQHPRGLDARPRHAAPEGAGRNAADRRSTGRRAKQGRLGHDDKKLLPRPRLDRGRTHPGEQAAGPEFGGSSLL